MILILMLIVTFNTRSYCVLLRFYPNVTTLRSGLCCRNSVCRLSVCLSVCLSVVCNVGALYSEVEPFSKISSPLCTLAIL